MGVDERLPLLRHTTYRRSFEASGGRSLHEVTNHRVVVNPRQARELLTAVTYVGQQRRGPHARGQRMMAL